MRTLVIAAVLVLVLLIAFAGQAAKAPAAPIDLNRATAAELMKLPGVGRTRAEAIVAFRTAHPFRRTTDLLRVKGLGRRTFGRLRQFVTVDGAGTPAATQASSQPAGGAATQAPSATGSQQASRAPAQAGSAAAARPPSATGSQ